MNAPRTWALVDHACRFCGSRVLADGDDFRCSSCGAHCRGTPSGICGCGLNLPVKQPVDAAPLYRCEANPNRGAGSPLEVVILCGLVVVSDQ
jgi:hypothetical protein